MGVTIMWFAMAILSYGSGGFSGKSSNNLVILVVFSVVAVAVWVWAISSVRAQNSAGKTLAELQALTPDAFEEWVAARFRDLGYSVKLTGTHGDHGVDLVVQKPGELAVVQCKKFKAWSVGEPVLRDLLGAMHDFGADRAYLVTTGKLTRAATEWVDGKPIKVWDGDYVAHLSMKMALSGSKANKDSVAPTVSISDAPSTNIPVQTKETPMVLVAERLTCPLCGTDLVEKRNRSTGEPFLACPRFPNCRFTRPMPS